MDGNSLAYFILWRVWLRLNVHPDWASRMDSRRVIEKLQFDICKKLSAKEQERVFAEIDHLRMMEVL